MSRFNNWWHNLERYERFLVIGVVVFAANLLLALAMQVQVSHLNSQVDRRDSILDQIDENVELNRRSVKDFEDSAKVLFDAAELVKEIHAVIIKQEG